MLTKLLTVSAFTLALTTGAMAQTSNAGDSSGSAGGTGASSSSDTGTTSGADTAQSEGAPSAGDSNTAGNSRDDNDCTDASSEKTASATSNSTPEAACAD